MIAMTFVPPEPSARPRRALVAVLASALVTVGACDYRLPDRRPDADGLTSQIQAMPGVVSASNDTNDNVAEGQVHFWLTVTTSPDVTSDQVAAVTRAYLHGLAAADYTGYQTELDIYQGPNRFAVDSGTHPVTNDVQIVEQATNWLALQTEFPGATIDARSAITHAPETGGQPGHPFIARVDLPDPADYTAVSAAVGTLVGKFPALGSGVWILRASKSHPADITTFGRLPTPAELSVWNTLNADQSIAHTDALTIKAPNTPPVWFAQQSTEADPAAPLALASRNLPIIATLPPPVLYTAAQQLQTHRNFDGKSTGAVAVTVGGCTPRTYRPEPAEQDLINTYEGCPH